MPNGNPPTSSLAATALKFILIFGSGAAAWALLMRWLNREQGGEEAAEQPQQGMFPMGPMASMPQYVPMPYPFAVPQFLQQPQPSAVAIVRNREEDEEPEEAPRRRRNTNPNRKRYADMTPDEVFESEVEKIRKRRAKVQAHSMFEEEDILEEFLSN